MQLLATAWILLSIMETETCGCLLSRVNLKTSDAQLFSLVDEWHGGSLLADPVQGRCMGLGTTYPYPKLGGSCAISPLLQDSQQTHKFGGVGVVAALTAAAKFLELVVVPPIR